MEKKTPNIMANYLYNLSYKLLAILVPLITTPYVSRVLGAEAIGAYSYTQSIATYFSIIGIMGLNLYGQLTIAKVRDADRDSFSQAFWEIFVAKVITSALSLLMYALLVVVYNQYTELLSIMGIMIVANIFDISWLFQGLEEFKKIVLRNYIIKIAGLILILCFVKDSNDVFLYAFILQGSTLLGNFSLWFRINRYLTKISCSWKNICNHIKRSFVYFLPSIATTIYTSTDKVMLGAIINSDYQNGIYEQAHKIEQVIITIISSLSTVLLPRLTYLYSNNNREKMHQYIGKTIKVIGLLEVPIMFGLFSVADIFIPVFLGEEFLECIGLIRIFSILILFSGLNTMIGDTCLVAQGKQGKYNIGVFSGAVANVILNLILIPTLKSYGAAIASLLSEVIVFAFFLHFAHGEYISIKKIFGGWTKCFIAAVPMAILVWKIGDYLSISFVTLTVQILVGIVVYFVLLLLMHDDLVFELISRLKRSR